MINSADDQNWAARVWLLASAAMHSPWMFHSHGSLETCVPSSTASELYLAMWVWPGVDALSIDSNKWAISSI